MSIYLNQPNMPKQFDAFLGGLISAGAGIVGGLLGMKSSSDSNASQEAMSAEQLAYQKEFAQHGVSWKADDARAAGIDPLAAMGSQTTYYPTTYTPSKPDYSFLGKAGQDVSRAYAKQQTNEQRELANLQLERARLDNKYASIRNMAAYKDLVNKDTQLGPGAPSLTDYGETNGAIIPTSSRIAHVPDQRTRSASDNAGVEAATKPFTAKWIDKEGRLRETISERAAESIESDWVGWAENNALRLKDKVRSYLGRPDKYPSRKPPKGHVWVWKTGPTGGYWYAVKKGKPGSLRWQGKEYKGGRTIHHGKIWK